MKKLDASSGLPERVHESPSPTIDRLDVATPEYLSRQREYFPSVCQRCNPRREGTSCHFRLEILLGHTTELRRDRNSSVSGVWTNSTITISTNKSVDQATEWRRKPPVRVGRCLVDEKRGCMKARRLIYERKSRVNARFRAPPGVK